MNLITVSAYSKTRIRGESNGRFQAVAKTALSRWTKPMGWTPPPRKGTVVSNWSFHTTSYRKGVHYEAYPCWGRFGKGCLPGSRR